MFLRLDRRSTLARRRRDQGEVVEAIFKTQYRMLSGISMLSGLSMLLLLSGLSMLSGLSGLPGLSLL